MCDLDSNPALVGSAPGGEQSGFGRPLSYLKELSPVR
jgi:hypothetical protein